MATVTSVNNTTNTTAELPPLKATDRCDRCSAAAKYHVILENGFDLYFCGHHSRKYESDLVKIAVVVQDERE